MQEQADGRDRHRRVRLADGRHRHLRPSSDAGVQLAVDEINAAGGVLGKKIRVVVEDDQSKPEEAATAVLKLIKQDEVVAVLGEVASSR